MEGTQQSLVNQSKKRARSSRGCLPCKLRKVKCDENPVSCRSCTRLGFKCSYDTDTALGPGAVSPLPSATDEPLPKKRTRQACGVCRANKLRCSGGVPKCERCQSRHLDCVYEQVQTTKPDESSTTALAEHSTPQPEPLARQSGVREPLGTRIRPNKAVDPRKIVIQQHIDIFFQYVHASGPYNFIHKGSFLRAWHSGKISRSLLRTVAGVASRFVNTEKRCNRSNEMVSPGPGWLEEAEREVLRDIDSISIPKLQILLLLTFDCTAKGRLSAVWYLSSLASRIAYALKLNYPTDAVVFTNQECRRRLMWCTYLLDKMIEGAGSPYPPLCPSDSIHLQLPCNSRLFELELDCDTDSLNDMASNNLQHVANLGVTAYLIRILDLRNQIQQYLTSERAKSGVQLPWSVESPLWIFKQQLTNFEDQLPAEMQNTERALYLRIHTPVADVYTMVHTWLHTTACELFGGVLRDVFPILHEDPNNDAPESEDSSYIMSQPPEFRSFCMAEIAKHFTTLNQFWSQMHSVQTLSKRFFVTDWSIGPCAWVNTCSVLSLADTSPLLLGDHDQVVTDALALNLEILEPLCPVSPYISSWAQKVLDAISRSPHRSIADEYLKTRSGNLTTKEVPISAEQEFIEARRREDARFANPKRGKTRRKAESALQPPCPSGSVRSPAENTAQPSILNQRDSFEIDNAISGFLPPSSMDQEHWLPPTGHDGGSLDGESQLSPAFFGLYAQGLYADDGTSILGDSPLHFDPHGLLMPDTFGGAPEIVGQAHQLSRSA